VFLSSDTIDLNNLETASAITKEFMENVSRHVNGFDEILGTFSSLGAIRNPFIWLVIDVRSPFMTAPVPSCKLGTVKKHRRKFKSNFLNVSGTII
jgi:hypothetical protein